MSRRMLLTALAVVAAMLAIALPAASASATTTAPAPRTAHIGFLFGGGVNPICPLLQGLLIAAVQSGHPLLANALAIQSIYLCPNPAI